MTAVVILSALTVCATMFLALFEHRLHPKHPSVRIYWAAPLVCAIVLVAARLLSPAEVAAGLLADTAVNPVKILLLFVSMTLMSIFLDEAGFFRYLAGAVLHRAGSSQKRLFFLLYLAVSVLTVFTSNDIVVLTFTPFICYFSKHARIDPLPYLITEFVAANTWSMALIIGNPTNIYLAASNGVDFAAYTSVMLLPTLFAGLVSLGMLYLIFRKKLGAPMAPDDERVAIEDRPCAVLGVACLGTCILLMVFSSYLNLPMWVIAVAACLVLYAAALPTLLMRKKGTVLISGSFRRTPLDVVPFVLSMFVIVLALDKFGVTALLGQLVLGRGEIWRTGGLSFLFANLINNIPMSVLFSSVVGGSQGALFAAIIGSNLGAFFSPMGALAGIMFLALLKQQGVSLSFGRFIAYGTLLSLPALAAALGGLALML